MNHRSFGSRPTPYATSSPEDEDEFKTTTTLHNSRYGHPTARSLEQQSGKANKRATAHTASLSASDSSINSSPPSLMRQPAGTRNDPIELEESTLRVPKRKSASSTSSSRSLPGLGSFDQRRASDPVASKIRQEQGQSFQATSSPLSRKSAPSSSSAFSAAACLPRHLGSRAVNRRRSSGDESFVDCSGSFASTESPLSPVASEELRSLQKDTGRLGHNPTEYSPHPVPEDVNVCPDSPREPTSGRDCHNKIRKELCRPLTPLDAPGIIYVFRNLNTSSCGVKIGMTRRVEVQKRIDEHVKDCKVNVEVLYLSPTEMDYCKRLENIIHYDLEDLRKPWACSQHGDKGKVHREYFDVSEELALQTVKKWEQFMVREKPYDSERQLRPIWTYLLNKRQLQCSTRGMVTHEARREQWETIFGTPSLADMEAFESDQSARTRIFHMAICCALKRTLVNHYWQIHCTGGALIMHVQLQNRVSLYFLIWILFSVVCRAVWLEHNRLPNSPKQ